VIGEAGRVWRPDHKPAIYTSLRLVGVLAAILVLQRDGAGFDVGLEKLSLGNRITILIKNFEVFVSIDVERGKHNANNDLKPTTINTLLYQHGETKRTIGSSHVWEANWGFPKSILSLPFDAIAVVRIVTVGKRVESCVWGNWFLEEQRKIARDRPKIERKTNKK
jgi:hypothetical protein